MLGEWYKRTGRRRKNQYVFPYIQEKDLYLAFDIRIKDSGAFSVECISIYENSLGDRIDEEEERLISEEKDV